jgi:hypothetical protein
MEWHIIQSRAVPVSSPQRRLTFCGEPPIQVPPRHCPAAPLRGRGRFNRTSQGQSVRRERAHMRGPSRRRVWSPPVACPAEDGNRDPRPWWARVWTRPARGCGGAARRGRYLLDAATSHAAAPGGSFPSVRPAWTRALRGRNPRRLAVP